MERQELESILDLHRKWLYNKKGGKHADLTGADLRGADLKHADLRGADLKHADLTGADLRGADLKHADLRGADLKHADLTGAYLRGADLKHADLTGADLKHADLTGAYLRGAKGSEYALAMTEIVPREGEFVGWKKAYKQVGVDWRRCTIYDACIVKLLIPHDAQRSNATGRKCRASKAKVLSIETFNGYPFGIEACSNYDTSFVYHVGKTVEVDNFDTDRLNECAPGIHFFITREEAENY